MTTRAPLWAFLLFAAIFCALSAWLGADASWDLRNYHLYDGHAALSGTLWRDIAPAQLQSYYPPASDAALFVFREALNAHPAILAALLALPFALAAWLALGVALRVGLPLGAATLAVLFGATGATGLSTLGTAMSEAVPECLVLAAFAMPCGRSLRAGCLAGIALGLKLTFAPYAIGLAAALLATARWRSLPSLAVGVAAGALLVAGPWWWNVWVHTGNPSFPYFNEIFRSAWAAPAPMTDTRFLPEDALHAIFLPFFWAFRPSRLTSELAVRDPRLALAWVGWLVVLARAAFRRELPPSPIRALLAFWVVAFVAWEARFSILRYTATLELLAGIPIALALAPLRVRVLAPVFAAIASITIYPNWGRVSGPLAADVRPPWFPAHTLVLLLDPSPMAYVAAFVPASIRFVGANSNLLHPGEDTALARAAAHAIARHAGPLWGLESPGDQPGEADRALGAYGLARAGPCARVHSNLDADAILACPLIRVQAPPPARRRELASRPSPPIR